jgi:hypothetical protein
MTIERDINESLTRLRQFKRRLWRSSIGAVLIISIQAAFLAVSASSLRSSAFGTFIWRTSRELQDFFMLSLLLSFILVVIIFIFERTVRSARIFSGELADAIGLYKSTLSSPNSSEVSAGAASTSDSHYNVGEDKLMQARLLLGEIAKRSSLPLLRRESELSFFLYIFLSLIILIAHAFIIYISLAEGR